MLLLIPSFILVVPFAWLLAAQGRWFCRNLRFPNGAVATFHGKGWGILGSALMAGLAVIGEFVIILALKEESPYSMLLLGFLFMALLCSIGLRILKWFCSRTEVTSAGPLRFTGTFGAYFGWMLLGWLAGYTIVGYAWVQAAILRWQCRNTQGQGLRFRFEGKGHQILWRSYAAVLGSLLVVTAPWMMMWLLRWHIAQVEAETT